MIFLFCILYLSLICCFKYDNTICLDMIISSDSGLTYFSRHYLEVNPCIYCTCINQAVSFLVTDKNLLPHTSFQMNQNQSKLNQNNLFLVLLTFQSILGSLRFHGSCLLQILDKCIHISLKSVGENINTLFLTFHFFSHALFQTQ